MSSLNARQVDTAKPRDKPYKLSDGGGLYLLINTNGSKYWKLKYRISSKEKKLSFGVYPDVSLADARNKRDEARKIIATGEDPSEVKKSKQIAKKLFNENTFEAIAIEWYTGKISTWSKNYASYVIQAFKNNVFPFIGNRPISDIKPLELLALLQRIEKRNAPQLASKVRQLCGGGFPLCHYYRPS
ncbi:Putative prophage CPS-53 integrase [Budvicia aquatica]|uniref:Prophage CPS-53 integrase n=1 Tax=Budvicia aquatica TaxID=82979 RepID=A0A484ZU40_9GAMM|nr:Putative prophage CPS-53 integrase [Budvicia aquatica]